MERMSYVLVDKDGVVYLNYSLQYKDSPVFIQSQYKVNESFFRSFEENLKELTILNAEKMDSYSIRVFFRAKDFHEAFYMLFNNDNIENLKSIIENGLYIVDIISLLSKYMLVDSA